MRRSFFRLLRLGRARRLRPLLAGLAWVAVAGLPGVLDALTGRPAQVVFYRQHVLVVALLAGLFYLNGQVLIPHLLARQRTGRYFAGLVLGMAGVAAGLFGGRAVLRGLGWAVPQPPATLPLAPLGPLLLSCLVVWVASSWGRITREWFAAERRQRQLATDQLAAELALLKSQISPHTLFNTLNSIYSLATLKSDDAPAAILKLSWLLRYMLYEADAPRVPLVRELEALENYVDLQRLRLDEQLRVQFDVEGDLAGRLLEPMLLLPFVENAFKHGISYQAPSCIEIGLRVADDALLFGVSNRRLAPAVTGEPPGGLGLANVRRRLALLYPGRHQLTAGPQGPYYVVELRIGLAATATPHLPPYVPDAHDAVLPTG